METSHRLKQAKSVPEDRKIQDGDPRINKNILEYRGMGHINRPARRLPPYSNSSKIPKIPAICTQASDLSVHLSSVRVFTMIVKEVKLMALSRGIRIHQYLDDWLIRAQSPEESSHNTKVVVDLTESLGWMINQVKSELIPTRVFSFVGYEYHLNSALVNPTQERWQKLQALILRITNQSALTARPMVSLIGLLASTEKMVPEGRTFQWHLNENWTMPQLLDKPLPWSDSIIAHLDCWQNPQNVLKGVDLHPQEHNVQVFTDASNVGWGAHLNQDSIKGLWSDLGKSLHINVFELMAVFLALKHFRLQCQNQTVLIATDNSTVVAYINEQSGTHSVAMCALLWRIMSWSLIQNISTCQIHSRVPKCDRGFPVQINSNSVNGVVSTPSGVQKNLHKVVHTSAGSVCHSAKPQVATIRLSSSRSKRMEHRCSKHSWSSLVAYAYPPTALLPKVIQKVRQYNCLLILIAPGWPGMP